MLLFLGTILLSRGMSAAAAPVSSPLPSLRRNVTKERKQRSNSPSSAGPVSPPPLQSDLQEQGGHNVYQVYWWDEFQQGGQERGAGLCDRQCREQRREESISFLTETLSHAWRRQRRWHQQREQED